MRKVFQLILSLSLILFTIPAFAQDATPEATPEATSVLPQPLDPPMAFYRFANFVPNASLSFVVNNQPAAVTALAYKAFSDWTAVPPGHNAITASSGSDTAATSQPAEVDFANGGFYTIAAVSKTDGTLTLESIDQSFGKILPGTSSITLVNAIQGSTNVDFIRNGSTYTANLFPLGNDQSQTSWFNILDDVDTYDFSVVENGKPDNVLVDAPATQLKENELYLIAAVGTADTSDATNIEFVVNNTDMSQVAMLQGVMQQPGTIIQAAATRPELAPWLQAVQQAGLTDTLSGKGPFTVFAPADFVFDNLPDSVRNDPTALANLLNGEIVQGDMRSKDVFKAGTLTTLTGTNLALSQKDGVGYVNDAQIIDVDIPATNGVIHIVNNFVTPPPAQ